MRVLSRLSLSSRQVASLGFLVSMGLLVSLGSLVLSGCGSTAPVPGVPAAEGSGSSSATPEPVSKGLNATSEPAEVETVLPLSWQCEGTEPKAFVKPLDRDVVTVPAEDATLSLEQIDKQRVRLNLPTMDVPARAMIALDHHPAREAADSQGLRELLTEWETVEPGSHRLLVFWLDEAGLPLQLSENAWLTFVRRFYVEEQRALPLDQWYLVSPRGTLNGKDASEDPAVGFPFGLSLLGLNPQGRLTLTVERSGVERASPIEAGNCALSGFQSGDYAFSLRSDTADHVTRKLTVNLDLGGP